MARLPYSIPYDPDFLGGGFRVPLPSPSCQGQLVQCGEVLGYIHFSLVMHQDRRTALYTAHNIDTSQRRSVPRDGWSLDNRIQHAYQTGPEAYYNNPWDRGHLVRRAAVAWGDSQEAQDASDSTFYYTNAALQHQKFNQDEWVDLEDWVLNSAGNVSPRLCVLTGPIYTQHDQYFGDYRIPSAFWKIVVLRDPTAEGNDLSAIGFVMKQNDLWDDWNGAEAHNLQTYQVGIEEIADYTGIDFCAIANVDEFEWRQARFRNRSRMKPIPIKGPKDIEFHGNRRRERGIRAIPIGRTEDPTGCESGGREASGCGCSRRTGKAESPVDSLVQQVDALRDLVEALQYKIDHPDMQQDGARALRDAQRVYERIVGGQTVEWGEFPECACIGYGDQWFCSGVLVAPRLVITAAHCAPQIDKVYLGGRAINLIGVDGHVMTVERVIVHPDYDSWTTPSHDIALLILKKKAPVAPVPIATNDEVNEEDNVVLVGFGYEHPTENIGFGTKRKVDVPLTGTSGMPEDKLDQIEILHGFDAAWEIHAGRKELGKDSCNGDSGGPAYILSNGQLKVAAVTSRASHSSELRCGDSGIYTRIAPYIPWINTVTVGMLSEAAPAAPPAPPAQESPWLYISACMPNPEGTDIGREWVEITNSGTSEVSLTGWAVGDRQEGRHELAGPLSAGSTQRIVLPPDSPVKLANKGDDVILKRGIDEVHKVTYGRASGGQVFRFDAPEPPEGEEPGQPEVLPGADPC